MNRKFWKSLLLFCAVSTSTLFAQKLPSEKSVLKSMQQVADWQCDQKLRHRVADWTNGALYAGMMEYAKIADSDKYLNWLMAQGDKAKWDKNPRNVRYAYHADDYTVGIMYLEMYRLKKDPKMIKGIHDHFNTILENPSNVGLDFAFHRAQAPLNRWSWCDALFMAPPVWAKMYKITGDIRYLDFMHQEYKASTDYLFDHAEHLFFRDSRYFSQKEPNGKKMFWGRGNGWVFGGLPLVLQELPTNYSEKMWYEKLFVDMAQRIATLQDKDGYWHASMLDHESYPNPETSCSSFFTFGLIWGVNNGYLDRETYLPAIEKGWNALVEAIHPNGKLGWAQPIGENPQKVTKDMTEVYAVGAFLMAGCEMLELLENEEKR